MTFDPTLKNTGENAPSLTATRICDSETPTERATPSRRGPPRLERRRRDIVSLAEDPFLLALPRRSFEGLDVPVLGNNTLILARLGQGGMGAVYYGLQEGLDREVAIKIVPPAAAVDPAVIDRFDRENVLAARARSPHLVAVLDRAVDHGIHYAILEYVHGTSARGFMDECLEKGRHLTEIEAVEITLGAARGLAVLHAEGIVHRDIKPDNIFLARNEWVESFDPTATKLGDFGIARGADSGMTLTQSQSGMGTPGYMAPEQVMDAKHATPRSDVFSLGATLYALLRGESPFASETAMDTLMATIKKNPVPLKTLRPDVSPELANFVHRCLDKDPSRRFPDASDVVKVLQKLHSPLPNESIRRPLTPLPSPAPGPKALRTTPLAQSITLEPKAPQPAKLVLKSRTTIHPPAVVGEGLAALVVVYILGRQAMDGTWLGLVHHLLLWFHSWFHFSGCAPCSETSDVISAVVAPFGLAIGGVFASFRIQSLRLLAASFLVFSAWCHVSSYYVSTAARPINLLIFESGDLAVHDWRLILQQNRLMDDISEISGLFSFLAILAGLAALGLWTWAVRGGRLPDFPKSSV